jgi:membrane associated rhomboid family serine protease
MDPDSSPPPAQPAAPPTCYRHPERETHIRCVRCNRSICPDCMVNAAVGFQCPDCVRAGNRTLRERRTTFGGRISDDPGHVSKMLIGLCVGTYLGQFLLGNAFTSRLFLIGRWMDPATFAPAGVAAGDFYRLITAAFLHGGIIHLALNMYALYLFGPPLEAALGRFRFASLYLLAALGGSAASYAANAPGQASLGASGAIFGLFAAYLVISRRLGRDATQLWVLLLINVVLGFTLPNIDWRAHLGGFVAGGATALVLAYAPKVRRTLLQALGAGLVLAVSLALVAVRTAELTGSSPESVLTCMAWAPVDPSVEFLGCLERVGEASGSFG